MKLHHYGYEDLCKLFYHDFALYLAELTTPDFPNVEENLRCEFHCKITLDDNNKVSVTNLWPFRCTKLNELRIDNEFCIYGEKKENPKRFTKELVRKFQGSRGIDMPLIRMFNEVELFATLDISSTKPAFSPISPGFFKGIFKSHQYNPDEDMIEGDDKDLDIIHIVYKDDQSLAGLHIKAAVSIPSGIIFGVNLCKPLEFTQQTQTSFAGILEAMHRQQDVDIDTLLEMRSQYSPFLLPNTCDLSSAVFPKKTTPSQSLWRFAATVNIPSRDISRRFHSRRYQDDSICVDANFIVFSDDIFGILYLENAQLNTFHRLKENVEAVDASSIFPDVNFAMGKQCRTE